MVLRNNKHIFFLFWMVFCFSLMGVQTVFGQKEKASENSCLNAKERNLAESINAIRTDYNKKRISLSKSLTIVAKTHVEDLMLHHPDTSICNLSSWSDQGNWTPCCYNPYVVNHNCMWQKPKELTKYPYRGYELVVYFQDTIVVDSLMTLWSESKEVLDMLLTRGAWEGKKWQTMGLAVNDHYASVWFGQRPDKEGAPLFCNKKREKVSGKRRVSSPLPSAYYLIFGSYNSMKEAKMAVKKLRKNGYKEAGVMIKKSYFRTYLSKYETLKEAMAVKRHLPPAFKDAWILKH